MVSRDVVLESLTITQPMISKPSGYHSPAFSISTQSDTAFSRQPLSQRVVLMHLFAELLRKIIPCIIPYSMYPDSPEICRSQLRSRKVFTHLADKLGGGMLGPVR